MANGQTHDGLTVQVIREESRWDAIRADWDALYAANPRAAAPMDFEWLRRWWQTYGPAYGRDGLRVVAVWDRSRLVAALPLYVGRQSPAGQFGARTLRFISTGESALEETCPEFLDLLCDPATQSSCLPRVWDAIDGLDWDVLELVDMAENALLRSGGEPPPGVTVESRGTSFVADISGGVGAYVERLSSSNRSHLRRLLRQGEKAGVRFDVASAETCDDAFDDLVRLHQHRWTRDGKPGVFAAPRFTEFHRGLVRAWVPPQRAVLARLWLGDRVLAAHYGFITQARFDLYQSGVEFGECEAVSSPGILAILRLIHWLADRHVTTFDFLRGPATHKERMSTSRPAMVTLRQVRPTPRGLAVRARLILAGWRRRHGAGSPSS